MRGRRIAYVLALAAALVFSALYPFWFSWYLVVLIVLIMPFDIIISIPGIIGTQISLSAPKMLEQGSFGVLMVRTHKRMRVRFPARSIRMRLNVSGENYSVSRSFMLIAEDGEEYEIVIDTSGSGGVSFHVRRIWPVSLIGLFAFPKKISRSAGTLVLPVPIKPPNAFLLSQSSVLRPKPGGGFAENHDLRQYRPGDPIRAIHWKASVKLDTLYVREPLIPLTHNRLVKTDMWENNHERDLILARLRWVSNRLLERELTFFVRLGSIAPVAGISNEADLTDYLFNALVKRTHANDAGLYRVSSQERFSWVLRVDANETMRDDAEDSLK